ncbi:MAG: type VI secretion system ATPase TssH [Thermoanaerobaculia bacterium]|jgi:type VI secretion system protein VasG|nr:type VI secretion system ATPase TssH [Thermoanaerobaculia bacterium]
MSVNLKSLIGRLNDTCRQALEGAAGLCLSRTNYDVEVEHLLLKLLEAPDTDLAKVLRRFEIDASRFAKDVVRALDRLKTGNARTPALSPRIPRLIEKAWVVASIEYGASRVRSGHLVQVLLTDDDLSRLTREISKDLAGISVEQLTKTFPDVVKGSAEDREAQALSEAPGAAGGPDVAMGVPGKTKSLDQYTEDLTAKARAGKIDPILGRDFEIRQVIDILTRRRQNNPILTGEAGVGKTAVVEGFAQRIAQGDVPGPLKNVAVRTLDLGLLQAGAGIKGEFENRLKQVIDEVKASPTPIILFIDEAHTMIGAGGTAGQNDAANLLKPALARGELRTIAATTWAEYKKYFEKDAALARRFQVVKVEEPSEEIAIVMMRALAKNLEKHHGGLRILDEAVESSVKLSHRYISGRQLPDKCVSVLDTACAKVNISQAATPAPIEDCRRRIDQLTAEIDALEREAAAGAAHGERIEKAKAAKAETEARLAVLDEQCKKEIELVNQIKETRGKLEAAVGGADVAGLEGLRGELDRLKAELKTVQGDTPMMQADVNAQAVAEVIAGWTGIPVGKMQADEIETVRNLAKLLGERVVGQDHALAAIAQKIQTSRAGLTDPRKPIAVFMFVGTSGVGKTETAIALAETLYGGERNMVTINMSEFQEAHTVSSLKGSPPGYVGYGEGGVLTEAVRRKPYSVVLLDEVEKAHPDVLELFYQVFDKGQMEDGEGREIDFKNCVILLTTNAESDAMMKMCADPDTAPTPEKIVETIKPGLDKVFKPAFLGRMSIVPYYPISEPVMKLIIKLQLGRIGKRLMENHGATFTYDGAVIDEIASRCKEVESGARNVDAILTRTVLPDLSGEFLARMAQGESISKVHVRVGEGGAFAYDVA